MYVQCICIYTCVCVCVCVWVRVCECDYVLTCVSHFTVADLSLVGHAQYKQTRVSLYIYIYICIYTHKHMYIHIYTYACICVCVCMDVCVRESVCVDVMTSINHFAIADVPRVGQAQLRRC